MAFTDFDNGNNEELEDDIELNQDDNDNDDNEEEEGDDELMAEAMRLLNGDSDEDDDDDDEDEGDGNGGVSGEQLQAEIKRVVESMSVPEDFIPEDFDPSDSKQLRGVMGKVAQQTALTTMQIVFKPVHAALAQMQSHFNTELDRRVKEVTSNVQGQSILQDMVPEIDDPELGPIVKNMDKAFRQSGKKPLERAKLLRKMLDNTGLGGGSKRKKSSSSQNRGRNRNRNQEPQNAGFRTGTDALDMFAPLPKKK